MTDYSCLTCGEGFDVVWQVTIGDSRGYKRVFPPGVREIAGCTACALTWERRNGGAWRIQA